MVARRVVVEHGEQITVEGDVDRFRIAGGKCIVKGDGAIVAVPGSVLSITSNPYPWRVSCAVLDVLQKLIGEGVGMVDIAKVSGDIAESGDPKSVTMHMILPGLGDKLDRQSQKLATQREGSLSCSFLVECHDFMSEVSGSVGWWCRACGLAGDEA